MLLEYRWWTRLHCSKAPGVCPTNDAAAYSGAGNNVDARDGGGGDGEENGTGSTDISPLLAAAGKAAESIPEGITHCMFSTLYS